MTEQLEFAAARAYYVMFYAAQALLLGEGVEFKKHSAVIAAFGERFAKTGRIPTQFHRYLIRGQEARTIGDYSTKSVDQTESADQLQRAAEFLEMAERTLGAEGR
jgi:uncharacterized protein (UPF0332 family)